MGSSCHGEVCRETHSHPLALSFLVCLAPSHPPWLISTPSLPPSRATRWAARCASTDTGSTQPQHCCPASSPSCSRPRADCNAMSEDSSVHFTPFVPLQEQSSQHEAVPAAKASPLPAQSLSLTVTTGDASFAPSSRPAIPVLTGLRGLLAVWILLHNYRTIYWGDGLHPVDMLPWWTTLTGSAAVSCFFCLSGFIMVSCTARHSSHSRTAQHSKASSRSLLRCSFSLCRFTTTATITLRLSPATSASLAGGTRA